MARANRQGAGGQNLITAIITAELADDWARYRLAITRWETVLRCSAPDPTELNRRGGPRVNVAFVEFMMGWPAGWVTAAGISRPDQLWIIGNGVVPQQVGAALRILRAV